MSFLHLVAQGWNDSFWEANIFFVLPIQSAVRLKVKESQEVHSVILMSLFFNVIISFSSWRAKRIFTEPRAPLLLAEGMLTTASISTTWLLLALLYTSMPRR